MKQVTLIVSTMKSLVPRVSGFLSNRDFEAGSVARVRAVKVRTDSSPLEETADTKVMTAVMFVEIWELEELANGIIDTLARCLVPKGNALIIVDLFDGVGLSCCAGLVAPDIVAGDEDTVAGDDLTGLEEGNITNK